MAVTFTATAEYASAGSGYSDIYSDSYPGDKAPPRVRLDVTITAGTGVSVLITRVGSDGRAQPVRMADPADLVGSTVWVGYDYEAPYGDPVTYTATVTYLNPGMVVAVVMATTTLAVSDVWLIHPGIPSLSMVLSKVKALGDRARPVGRGVFQPFGRADPIVVTDGRRKAVQSQLSIRTSTLGELEDIIALTADAAVLLLNVPGALGWGVGAEYISLGDLSEVRETSLAAYPCRLISAPYLVVARPIGGSQSLRTWVDVMAYDATWADVLSGRATWLEVLAPTT